MRILCHGVPPWAQSGYGRIGQVARVLAELGHQVAISAYAGVLEEREWNGIPILGTAGRPYGNGLIAFNYRRWRADVMIMFCDMWTIDVAQLAGLNLMPWVPIDTHKLGIMDKSWLGQASKIASVRPVAMSEHGQRCLAEAGFEAPLVEIGFDPGFDVGPGLRDTWRRELKVPERAFVISKVGVNNEDDRKSFGATLQAFAQYSRGHSDAYLYLHTEAQAPKAPNLAWLALDLGLKGRVAFADEDRRRADLYSTADMRAIYCGSDVLDAATKGEGFGVPVVEALACGTPVIAARNSAMPEKIRPEYGWLVDGQPTIARHHQAWWHEPSVEGLVRAYGKARIRARSMRLAAAKASDRWTVWAMRDAWEKALAG